MMKKRFPKLTGSFNQFWHCLRYTLLIPFTDKYGLDHRAVEETVNGKFTYLGCMCGKKFYGQSFTEKFPPKKVE